MTPTQRLPSNAPTVYDAQVRKRVFQHMTIDVQMDVKREAANPEDLNGLDRAVSEIPRLLVRAERRKRSRRRMKWVAAVAVLILLLVAAGLVAWSAGWIGPFELPWLDALWKVFQPDS